MEQTINLLINHTENAAILNVMENLCSSYLCPL